VPSTFEENLDVSEFPEIHEYPVATATHKAIQVYEKLVVSRWLFQKHLLMPNLLLLMKEENPDNAPDLVIAGVYIELTSKF
jgi:septum formation protein